MENFWYGFVDIAESLTDTEIEIIADRNTLFRSSVNRYYYYFFHEVIQALSSVKLIEAREVYGKCQHERVIQILNLLVQNCRNTREAALFNSGYSFLYTMRAKCDYQDFKKKEDFSDQDFMSLKKKVIGCKMYLRSIVQINDIQSTKILLKQRIQFIE